MFKRKATDKPEVTMPAPSTSTRLHEVKRFRGEQTKVDEKIQIVSDAVGATPGRQEACLHMLVSMCAGGLGPAHNERDDFQRDGVTMIGRALNLIEEYIMKVISELEMKLSQAKDVVVGLEDRQKILEANLRQAQEVSSMKGQAVTDAKKACDEALQQKRAIQNSLKKAEADMAVASREKAFVEDLYNSHFLPLMNGNFTGLSEANMHIDALRSPLQSWGCEDCLLAGFCESARHTLKERKEWCTRSMQGVDQFFQKPLQDAEAKYLESKEVVERLRRDLRAAEDLCAERDEAHSRAVEELQQARMTENQCAEELNALRKELQAAIYAVKDASRKLEDKKAELQGFKDGPLEAYNWLKDNAIKGQYETVSRPRLLYQHDPQVSEKVKIVTNALERYALQTVPCKDMLSNSVPGSLGTAKNERDEFQDESVDMVGRALQLIIVELERQVSELELKLQQAKDAQAAVEMRKHEAVQRLQDAKQVTEMKGKLAVEAKNALDEASKEKRIAQQNVSTAEGKFRQAEGEKAYREDLYNNHFLPLKNGQFASVVEANSHIDVLRPALSKWGIEDCLLAAFQEASRKLPKDRRDWCTRTMEGVDEFFQKPLQDAEMTWRASKEELEARRRELQTAESVLAKAQADHQHSLQELQAARAAESEAEKLLAVIEKELRTAISYVKEVSALLEAKNRELLQFKEVVFQAYTWLRERTK